MPTPNSPRIPRNLEQQRKLAKDLIRAARDADALALARIRAARPDCAAPPEALKLADAQLTVAREAGFESWPKLAAAIQDRDVEAFHDAIRAGDVDAAQQLLASEHVANRINEPMFEFGQSAAHIAAKNAALLRVLIAAGADVNLKSDWENGPYAVLDNADERTARFLLAQGAKLTPIVAARLGWLDELRSAVDADARVVHARGGDGQQPLHEAKTVAIADFLLDRGADIDARCIDHQSTPAQYALVDRPEVCRRLLDRGATPDIFMAARLGDLPLATRLVDAAPACVAARISQPGYPPVPTSSIYCWSLGFGMSPHDIALKFDHREVHELLAARSPARVRLLNAIVAADEAAARAAVAEDPSLLAALSREDHEHLARAIFHEHFGAAEIMLRLGFDPVCAQPCCRPFGQRIRSRHRRSQHRAGGPCVSQNLLTRQSRQTCGAANWSCSIANALVEGHAEAWAGSTSLKRNSSLAK